VKSKLLVLALIGVLIALVSVSFAASKTPRPLKFSAALNIGQEKPHPKGTKAGASGRFTASLSGTSLTWKLTFRHLSGPATAAHIHMGAKGVNGAILVPLCPPCTSPVSGTSTLTAAEIADMKARKLYVNVHTAKNPNGEIRGQITRAL
jgi:CHRD domain